MQFALLNAEVENLRRSIRSFVGESALEEINVQSPAGCDEASFLRLVTWSYVLVFEAGRVTIPFLLKLSSGLCTPQSELQATSDLVHDLRTWSFHNLSFASKRELEISRRTTLWFISNSGSSPPNDIAGWRSSFESLCTDVYAIVAHCKAAFESVLSASEDKQTIINDLKRRVDRNWPAPRFDELVSDAALRIGQRLDVPRFRQSRLSKWKNYLQTIPEDDEPEAQIVRFIERDVLDHFEFVLPIDGKDVMAALGIRSGPAVGRALRHARHLYGAGVTDRNKLLACLQKDAGNPTA